MPRLAAVAIAAAAAFAAAGCRKARSDAPSPEPSRPAAAIGASASSSAAAPRRPAPPADLSVLLITVDALRADMPWVGYPRPVAPRLTRLAGRSVVYTHAYALSSYTSMSLGGLMAGRYPSELPRNGKATSTFFDDALFLAEILRSAGVRTVGVHGHVYFLGATGIAQGFDDWRVVPRITLMKAREGAVTDDRLASMTIAALDEHFAKHADRRLFAWVHFMDPHFSYVPHEGFPRYRGAPGADGGVRAVPPGVPLSEAGQRLRNLHDGEVTFTDHQIGRLLDHVDGEPWGARTAVIVTADHGEAFGEHRSYFEHGYYVYEVTTRVPLLFRIPGVKPRRIDARRSQIDMARTLLDLLDIEAPRSLLGTSLVPELLGAEPEERDVVIDMPYTDQSPRRRALIHGDVKVIVTESHDPELYDLSEDPSEQNDLAASRPKLLARMIERVRRIDAEHPDYPAPRRAKREY